MQSFGTTTDLLELLEIEEVDRAVKWRSRWTGVAEPRLYGGLTAALATRAASASAVPGMLPHVVHTSFIHPGTTDEPLELRVEHDRDGRLFATRTVGVRQSGRLLARVMVSLQHPEPSFEWDAHPASEVRGPDLTRRFAVPRLTSFEGALPVGDPMPDDWPTRLWVRCTAPLAEADAGLRAAVLVYLSDISTGLSPLRDDEWSYGPSLNHTVWLTRPVDLTSWALLELEPRSTGDGRGLYYGRVSTPAGSGTERGTDTSHTTGARFAQESLFRAAARDHRSRWLPGLAEGS